MKRYHSEKDLTEIDEFEGFKTSRRASKRSKSIQKMKPPRDGYKGLGKKKGYVEP